MILVLILASCTTIALEEDEIIEPILNVIEPEIDGKVYFIGVGTDYVGSRSGDLLSAINDVLEIGTAYTTHLQKNQISYETKYFVSSFMEDPESPDYPTWRNVIKYLKSLEVNEKDFIFFYFAGHALNSEGEIKLSFGRDFNTSKISPNGSLKSIIDILDQKN